MTLILNHSTPAHILSSPILIVDDTELTQKIAINLLTVQGFTSLTCAYDGVEALEKIALCKPDLIILDLLMPRMDGFSLCRHLRALPEYQRLPILIQTAVENQDDYDKVFAVGATDLIKKPIIPAMLITKVIEHLEVFYTIMGHKNH